MEWYYRRDIDGLKGICIVAVILTHVGLLPGGSVDVFFVISGFLITGIIQKKRLEGTFSLKHFYIKRVRRILPLLLSVNVAVLFAGYFVMLPDDLENLGESVVATIFFANNILLYITDGNYWAKAVAYKPLLHTWTLAIEEQFYITYPLLLLLFKNRKHLLLALIVLTVVSLLLYFGTSHPMLRYYFPHTRFFQLGAGGIASFATKKLNRAGLVRVLALIALVVLLFFSKTLHIPLLYKSPLITIATVLFVLPAHSPKLLVAVLENKPVRYLGLISFSLYMWHQPVLAFVRYTINPDITGWHIVVVLFVILIISILSFYIIEQPFRNEKMIKTTVVIGYVTCLLIITTAAGLWLYNKAGIVRDVPELDISKEEAVRHMHALYNDSIYMLDKNFVSDTKLKILIVGHSFARDWANVLLQSRYKNAIEISYIFNLNNSKDAFKRVKEADFIYFSPLHKKDFDVLSKKFRINEHKIKITGFKNFGINNGIFYNERDKLGYCNKRVAISSKFIMVNNKYKSEWGDKYIDLLGMVIDNNGTVPVFTPNCKFISQDCKHFTKEGANWYADILRPLPELENNYKIIRDNK